MIDQFPNTAVIDDQTCPLYFLHIPKTGGTTFQTFLVSHFVDENVCPAHLWNQLLKLSPTQIEQYSLIRGHFYSYLFRYISCPLRYLTLLRDPAERAISHYGHIMRHPDHYLHLRARELNDFGAYLRDPILATTVTNFQVRSLTFDHDPVAIASTLSVDELAALDLERQLEASTPRKADEDMLELAKHRLSQMCFVGISERMDDSILLLCKKLAWQKPEQVESHNINPARLRRSDISRTDLEYLMKINQADYELYEYANRLLTQHLSE